MVSREADSFEAIAQVFKSKNNFQMKLLFYFYNYLKYSNFTSFPTTT